MDRKKKIRVAVIIPVIVTLLVLGGVITLVLVSGSNKGPESVQSMDMAEAGAETPGEAGGYAGEGETAATPPADGAQGGPPCAFDFLVGQPSSVAVEQVTPLDRPYRIVPPGGMVTQDYSPARINLITDPTGIVRSVTCG